MAVYNSIRFQRMRRFGGGVMNVLEKILEEIEEEIRDSIPFSDQRADGLRKARDIIRKLT